MEIGNTSFNPSVSDIYGLSQQKNTTTSGQNVQSSGDTVSISAEAFALAKQKYIEQSEISDALEEEEKNELFALQASKESENSSTTKADKGDDESAALREKFATYMYTPDGISSGGSSDSGDVEKQIKALENQIDTLQGQLVELSESGTSELGLEAQSESIYKNIEGIEAQISALREQQSKQSKAPEASPLAKK